MKELKGLSTDFFLFWPVKSLETHSNPIQDGPFRGCSRMRGGGQKAPLPKIYHTYPTNDEIWDSYSLPKEDPKNI